MGKWIDADTLINEMRGKFIDSIEEEMAIAIVYDTPSIDIVRCKECKKTNDVFKHTDKVVWCSKWKYVMKADDFCSYGEVRDE